MCILYFNQIKRRIPLEDKVGQIIGEVLYISTLSENTMDKIYQRELKKQQDNFNIIIKITRNNPDILPSIEQMEEFINGIIEL